MVKHHQKKKKKLSKSKKDVAAKEREIRLKNLDQFAGSSDEEDGDGTLEIQQASGKAAAAAAEAESDEKSGDSSDDYEQYDQGGPRRRGGVGARKRSGSAGVESSDDEADSEDEREHKSSTAKKGRRRKEEAESSDNDDDEDDDGDAYGEDEFGADQDDADAKEMESADEFEGGDTSLSAVASKSAGMAGAMTRILGVAGGSAAGVLSKTKTPLQKLQEKQKSVDAALREKRRERRDTNLTAMRVPLSAATSRPLLTSDADGPTTMIRSAIAQELEVERAHRRVATRGVVALFNAISKHQDKMREDASAEHRAAAKAASASGGGSKSAEEVKVMSKRGFLDLLKTNATKVDGGAAAAANKSAPSVSEGAKGASSKSKTGGWNALKDDYMMTSKLKDWDKELTDEEDSDDDDDDEAGAAAKRQRVKA